MVIVIQKGEKDNLVTKLWTEHDDFQNISIDGYFEVKAVTCSRVIVWRIPVNQTFKWMKAVEFVIYFHICIENSSAIIIWSPDIIK